MKSGDETQEVGKISKQWTGFMKEYFTKADNFGVSCKNLIYIREQYHKKRKEYNI